MITRSQIVNRVNSIGSEGHNWTVTTYNNMKALPRGYKLQLKDPWCAAFVTAIFYEAGVDSFAECSCTMMLKKAKAAGLYVEDNNYHPKVGDIVLYDWQKLDGDPDHVGIVIDVYDGGFLVREGNKSNTVGNRSVTYNQNIIRGFITPEYTDSLNQDKMSRVMERLHAIDYASAFENGGVDEVINEVTKTIKEGLL